MLDGRVFYASFDEGVKADVGGGELTVRTRFNHDTEKGQFVFEDGFDGEVFRVVPGGGIRGGALEVVDVLPRNGRIFFPAKGNLGYRKGGWSGSVSFWLKTNPNTMLKTRFCDPVQITQKGATNGGLWVDFPDTTPRDLRLGAFPSEGNGRERIPESAPDAPLVRVVDVGFEAEDWHHVAFMWRNFDTGREDGHAALYIDGELKGELKNRNITMDWDIEQTGIYIAVNYIGLLDELAIFDRPLTGEEVTRLCDPRRPIGP
ncbi:MAG: LamG domain-containing protein [bacterium]|nr:LamG domain-containing protein [bacterium]